ACRALAVAELAIGERFEAIRDMRACLKDHPDDPRAWRDSLTMLQSLGDQESFDAVLAQVPKLAESEPEIWMLRGQASEKAGDGEGAAENYRQALQRNPNLLKAHYRLAMTEERLGHR